MRVIKSIMGLVGGDIPSQDDVCDIFDLLDVNGDESIDKKELSSLLTVFFKML